MKLKLIKFLAAVFVLTIIFSMSAYSADFYVFGINGNWIKKAQWEKILLGAVSSVVAHEAGHIIALELTNSSYSWNVTTFEFTSNSNSDAQMIGRSGFIAQHGVNLLLTSFKKESDFTKEYTLGTGILHLSYPLRNRSGGDLETLDKRGGNGMKEWMFFNGLLLHNIF